MHEHEWVTQAVINVPERDHAEVHEVCVSDHDCEFDYERIRTVRRLDITIVSLN